jgi:hypothetical protein
VGKELHQAECSTLILFGAASLGFYKSTSQESYIDIVDSYFSFVNCKNARLFFIFFYATRYDSSTANEVSGNLQSLPVCHTRYISAVGMNTVHHIHVSNTKALKLL